MAVTQRTFTDVLEYTPPANPYADARPIATCDKCGCTQHRDRRIHESRSIIRECARCRRFTGFPLWYSEELPHR